MVVITTLMKAGKVPVRKVANMSQQKAVKRMSEICEAMYSLYKEAVKLADDNKIEFSLPWGGEGVSAQEGYGAGATYYPAGVEDWNKYNDDEAQWVSSSRTC